MVNTSQTNTLIVASSIGSLNTAQWLVRIGPPLRRDTTNFGRSGHS